MNSSALPRTVVGLTRGWVVNPAAIVRGVVLLHFCGEAKRSTDPSLSRSWARRCSASRAVVAAALLELSGYVDATTSQRYRAAALATLDTFAGPSYLNSSGAREATLLHGVGNYPEKSGVDAGLIYGDYYLVEAVLRFEGVPAP